MKHLGEAIKEELNGQERSVTWFARQLSCGHCPKFCVNGNRIQL